MHVHFGWSEGEGEWVEVGQTDDFYYNQEVKQAPDAIF